MSAAQPSAHQDLAPTRDLARWSSALAASQIPENATLWAKHALLDWFGVTIAGAREELAPLLQEEETATARATTLYAHIRSFGTPPR